MNFDEFIKELEYIKKEKPILFQLEQDNIVREDAINEYEKYYGVSFAESYRKILKELAGGYFGYIVLYSLDNYGKYNIKKYISIDMVKEYGMLPVIDLETGDYIGFDIENKKCTEKLMIWLHEEKEKKMLDIGFYELLINVGLKNKKLNIPE